GRNADGEVDMDGLDNGASAARDPHRQRHCVFAERGAIQRQEDRPVHPRLLFVTVVSRSARAPEREHGESNRPGAPAQADRGGRAVGPRGLARHGHQSSTWYASPQAPIPTWVAMTGQAGAVMVSQGPGPSRSARATGSEAPAPPS